MATVSDNGTAHQEQALEPGRGDQVQGREVVEDALKQQALTFTAQQELTEVGSRLQHTGSGSGGGQSGSQSRGGARPVQSKGSARPLAAPSTIGTLPEQDGPSLFTAPGRTPSIARGPTLVSCEEDAPLDVSKALSLVQEVIQERPPPSRCASTVVEAERPMTRTQSRLASRAMSRGLSNSSRVLSSLPGETHSTTDRADTDARRLEQKQQRQEEAARKTRVVQQQRGKMEFIKWEAEQQGAGEEGEEEEEKRRKQLLEQLERERLEMQLCRARELEARRREEEEEKARLLHELQMQKAREAREEEQRMREARQLERLRRLEDERLLWELITSGVQEEQSWVQRQWEGVGGVAAAYYSGEDYKQQLKEEEDRLRERERARREEQERMQAESLKAELLRQRALLHHELLQDWLACMSVQLTPAFSFSYFPAHGPCSH